MRSLGISALLRTTNPKGRHARVIAAAIALFASACGKPGAPEGGPADAAAPEDTAASASASAAPRDGAKAPAAPGSPRIQVAIKDLQIFHPYAADRAMPSVKEDGTFSTRDAKLRYGVGLIVEATNQTGELLRDAWFEGSIRFTGSGGQEIVCELGADVVAELSGARFLSYAPKPPGKVEVVTEETAFGPKTDWKDESESALESPWRPSERVRMMSRRNECEALTAGDLGATAIKGRVVVKARKIFVDVIGYDFDEKAFELALDNEFVRIRDRRSQRVVVVPVKEVAEMKIAQGSSASSALTPLSHVRLGRVVRTSDADLVESEPVEFDIRPRALTLQLVKLPSGQTEHASGNIVIHQKEGKVVYEEMARLKMSLIGAEFTDIPAATPEITFEADELSGKATNITLKPSADDPALTKGQRALSVTWKISLKTDQIDGRLRSAFDAASAAFEAAERAAFMLDMNSSADKAEVAKAKADAASAKSARDTAERKYKSGLSSERTRLTKLFVCGDARLATNKGVRSPSNAKAASDTCKELEKSGDVEVTLAYTLERYEIPVALVYSLGKTQAFRPIASEALLKLDPR
jgi:hypothetical protein